MSTIAEHPTVRKVKALIGDDRSQPVIGVEQLASLALECGAADAGNVSVEDSAVDVDREYIRKAFPKAKVLLSYLCRMHREPLRSPMFAGQSRIS